MSIEIVHSDARLQENVAANLGLDIGRVILRQDTDLHERLDFNKMVYLPDALEVIPQLVRHPNISDVYLISKCGPVVEEGTKDFFKRTNFYKQTGIVEKNVFFCRKREDKAPIAASIGITHFVDDREDVLRFMNSVMHKYLFRFDAGDEMGSAASSSLQVVNSWTDLLRGIQQSFLPR